MVLFLLIVMSLLIIFSPAAAKEKYFSTILANFYCIVRPFRSAVSTRLIDPSHTMLLILARRRIPVSLMRKCRYEK